VEVKHETESQEGEKDQSETVRSFSGRQKVEKVLNTLKTHPRGVSIVSGTKSLMLCFMGYILLLLHNINIEFR